MSVLKRYSPALVCLAVAIAALAGLQPTRANFVAFSLALTVSVVVAEVERARVRNGIRRRNDAGN